MHKEASLSDLRINDKTALDYGFNKVAEGEYQYQTKILDNQFTLSVYVVEAKANEHNCQIFCTVIDNETGELYNLHRVVSTASSFANLVKETQAVVVQNIVERCFVLDRFHNLLAQSIIDYVKQKYGSDLEYLWEKAPNNAICRRKDNNKWFLALLTVKISKLFKGAELSHSPHQNDDEQLTVLNLRITPDELDRVVDDNRYFRGYHMNKKHWLTICLDGRVPLEEIYQRIDQSYLLAVR